MTENHLTETEDFFWLIGFWRCWATTGKPSAVWARGKEAPQGGSGQQRKVVQPLAMKKLSDDLKTSHFVPSSPSNSISMVTKPLTQRKDQGGCHDKVWSISYISSRTRQMMEFTVGLGVTK